MLLTHVGAYVRPTVGFGRNGEKPYAWGVTFGSGSCPDRRIGSSGVNGRSLAVGWVTIGRVASAGCDSVPAHAITILTPSKSISDQWTAVEFVTRGKKVVAGVIVSETADKVVVQPVGAHP